MDPAEPWQTKRLLAEPLTPDHAMALHGVISDPSMHEFMGGTPLGLGELTKRYQVLARRRSPDGTEIWCNWALREMSSGELVGTVQATLPAGGPGLATPAHRRTEADGKDEEILASRSGQEGSGESRQKGFRIREEVFRSLQEVRFSSDFEDSEKKTETCRNIH